ncbi:MAG: PqqD family protein [Candidatus Kapabacteria bacterium]|nr:PqqD family protein [Candidatus Kapabacteria bacterium]
MELTPLRLHEFVQKEDGLVDVLVPKFKNTWLTKLLIPKMKNPYMRANLDSFGSETWLLIDGNTKVETITNKLTEKFGDELNQAPERIGKFFNNLFVHKFITFIELRKDHNG